MSETGWKLFLAIHFKISFNRLFIHKIFTDHLLVCAKYFLRHQGKKGWHGPCPNRGAIPLGQTTNQDEKGKLRHILHWKPESKNKGGSPLSEGGERRPLRGRDSQVESHKWRRSRPYRAWGQQEENTPARQNQCSQHRFSELDFLLQPDFKASKTTRLVLKPLPWLGQCYDDERQRGNHWFLPTLLRWALSGTHRQVPRSTKYTSKMTKTAGQGKWDQWTFIILFYSFLPFNH